MNANNTVIERMCQDIKNPYLLKSQILDNIKYFSSYLRMDYKHYDSKYVHDHGWYDDMPTRTWRYQQCTEFGMFNVPSESYSYSSSLLTKEAYAEYCRRLFGADVAPLDVKKLRMKFNELEKTKNILLTS